MKKGYQTDREYPNALHTEKKEKAELSSDVWADPLFCTLNVRKRLIFLIFLVVRQNGRVCEYTCGNIENNRVGFQFFYPRQMGS